jgi:glycosyltransferase involved in cell wall biosynthesis
MPAPKPSARLLFVAHTARLGGPTFSLLLLLRYLRQGYEVAVLLPEDGALCQLLAEEDIPYFIIPGLGRRTIYNIFQLVCRQGFDLVYGNNPSSCSRNALFAAKLARKPFIWHFRGIKWHWDRRKGRFINWADAVVAASRSCAESIERFRPLKDIEVIYNGVELSTFPGSGTRTRSDLAGHLGLTEPAHYLISVSHVTPLKGHEKALEVMARVVAHRPDAHLLIAGSLERDPSYYDKIRRLLRHLGLEQHVHLLGFRPDVPRLLAGAELFLHTAGRDAHPRAVIEAMAAGLPVVAYAVDGVAETVVEGATGRLLPWGAVEKMAQVIVSLLNSPAQRAEMGRQAQARVAQHFTAAGTAAQVAQVIDKLLERQRPRGRWPA